MIDTAALDAAVRRFPSVLTYARWFGPAYIPQDRHVDAIRLEYRLVRMERAGVVPGMASQ